MRKKKNIIQKKKPRDNSFLVCCLITRELSSFPIRYVEHCMKIKQTTHKNIFNAKCLCRIIYWNLLFRRLHVEIVVSISCCLPSPTISSIQINKIGSST